MEIYENDIDVHDECLDADDMDTEDVSIEGAGFFCKDEASAYEEKWRSVFRQSEAAAIYMDITLTNNNYQIKGWEGDIVLKLHNADDEEIEEQTIHASMEASDDESTYSTCFEALAHKPGKYYVTVCIDDKEARGPDFYIVDMPDDYGKCFTLEDFSFYRRNEGEAQTDYRKNTLTGFNIDKLAAIDAFFLARNKLDAAWPAEFIVSVFDQRGMLIQERTWHNGEPIEGGDKNQFHFFAKFGDEKQSFWRKGNYRVEVVFMNELIIEAPFVIGDKDIETPFNPVSVQPRRLHGGKQVLSASTMNINGMEEINGMIGLTQLKKELKRYVDKVKYNEARKQAGYAVKPIALHSVYLGNPGTGKTTVARLMGKVFHDLGLLTKGHVVIEERNSLTGKFYGSEEEKTNQAIERAQGGVLFIDEAYSLLVKDDPKDPGRRIMETLLTTLSDETNRDICIILAGYPNPMIDMLNENPGMKSRLPNVYHFDDYSVDELMQIADTYLETNQYVMTAEAHATLRLTVEKACSHRDSKFGNGRYIITLLENRIIPNLASRLVAAGNMDETAQTGRLILIEKEDVDNTETETKDADYFKQKKHIGYKFRSSSHA